MAKRPVRVPPGVLLFVFTLLAILAFSANTSAGKGQARAQNTPARLAVFPFRNALEHRNDGNGAVLGDAIADSLTNALKSVSKLSVTDSQTVVQAMATFPPGGVETEDARVESMAQHLSLQLAIIGSYQLLPGLLHVDARILFFGKSARRPQVISVDGKYPEEYSLMLNKLADAITSKLAIPIRSAEAENIKSVLANVAQEEAYDLYSRGEKQRALGTKQSLERALALFDAALQKSPDYALALAAKAETQVELFKFEKASGTEGNERGRQALSSARSAVSASPNLGRAYAAEAAAQAALGDMKAALRAAERAKQVWPNDGRLQLDLAKALAGGRLTRSRETDRAFALQPGLGLLFPELPKVLVQNTTDHPFTLKFKPDDGAAYPETTLPPHSSRMVPVFPGAYEVAIEGALGKIVDRQVFEGGADYRLDLSGTLPLSTFTFVNNGRATLRVSLAGPTKKSLKLGPLQTQDVEVLAGEYRVTATIPGASRTDQHELAKGEDERVEYQYTGSVFNPASLTVENSGNTSFTLTLSGTKSYSFRIPPNGKTFSLQAGEYDLRASCGGQSAEGDHISLEPNTEAVVSEFGCNVYYR